MRVFTVHAAPEPDPPGIDLFGSDEAPPSPPPRRWWRAAPEAPQLVPEGFSAWAFLLQPFWLLRHGLWLALLGWGLLSAAIGLLLPPGAAGAAALALALLLGFHGRDLQRHRLRGRGLAERGVVVGHDEEEALLRLAARRPDLLRPLPRPAAPADEAAIDPTRGRDAPRPGSPPLGFPASAPVSGPGLPPGLVPEQPSAPGPWSPTPGTTPPPPRPAPPGPGDRAP